MPHRVTPCAQLLCQDRDCPLSSTGFVLDCSDLIENAWALRPSSQGLLATPQVSRAALGPCHAREYEVEQILAKPLGTAVAFNILCIGKAIPIQLITLGKQLQSLPRNQAFVNSFTNLNLLYRGRSSLTFTGLPVFPPSFYFMPLVCWNSVENAST
eukprot:763801-Hanusia_phi.AAC.1